MRIEASTIKLSATHEASYTSTVDVETVTEFRQLFNTLATQASDDQQAAKRRVEKLLQALVDAILAAIDGRPCEEKFAACDNAPAEAASPGGREMRWQRTITTQVEESEKTTVCGQGCVRTADGRDIEFDYSLALARDYRSNSRLAESGSMVLRDPLVLSFAGQSCELSETRIDFDLDADGVAEKIPGLGQGSCFLVFDRNGNGRADNGSELFGVASGDGFADLALLDGDGNGWIDEADAAFAELALWSGDSFTSLKEKGVGALSTAAVDAPFLLKTASNELLGQIRAAGIYLSEAGEVGHLQQVDLAVSTPARRTEQPEQRQQLAT